MTSTNDTATLKADTIFDHMQAQSPVPTVGLKDALKKVRHLDVVGVRVPEGCQEGTLRAFCQTSGHIYRGHQNSDGGDVHFIQKKQAMECQACANWRSVIAGGLCLSALAYTSPQVLNGSPDGVSMIVFVAALSTLPALICKNGILLMRAWKKIHLR